MLLADRIVLMTNGPAATVGEIVTVPFARPRDRLQIVDDPLYERVRSQLITFLEERAKPRQISPNRKTQGGSDRRMQLQTSCSSSRNTLVLTDSGRDTASAQPNAEPVEVGDRLRNVVS